MSFLIIVGLDGPALRNRVAALIPNAGKGVVSGNIPAYRAYSVPLGDLPQAMRNAVLAGMRSMYYRGFVQNSPEDPGEELEPRGDWRTRLIPPWLELP